jgi:hypothetical protein
MIRLLFLMALLPAGLRPAQMDLPAAASVSPFTRQELSARSAALGVAFSALSGGIDSLYANPAGLAEAKRWSLGLNHHQWLLDITQQSMLAAGPWKDWNVGIGGRYIGYGKFDDRDISGAVTGQTQLADQSIRLGFSHGLPLGFSAGAAAEIGTQKIAGDAPVASGSAGLQSRFAGNWQGGLSMAYRAQANGVAGGLEGLRGGVSWAPVLGELRNTVALGASLEPDSQLRYGLGMELAYLDYALRGSYQARGGADASDPLAPWSVGFGVKRDDLSLDYAFRPLGSLGNDNRFSLTYLLPESGSGQGSSSEENGLWNPGTWLVSIHGGAMAYLPYSSSDLEKSFNGTGATTDISPGQALLGGLSVGLELPQNWLVEAGAEYLTPRRFHLRQDIAGSLFSDIDQKMQPLLAYGNVTYRWRPAPGWALSAGAQLGYGYLLSTQHTELPILGLKTDTATTNSAISAMPLLRLERQLGGTQSLGLEAGYRYLRFGQGAGGSTDIGDFSGFTAALRWAMAVKKAAPAAPIINAPPASVSSWKALGDLELKEGRRRQALDAFKEALKLDPQDETLKAFVEHLEGTLN